MPDGYYDDEGRFVAYGSPRDFELGAVQGSMSGTRTGNPFTDSWENFGNFLNDGASNVGSFLNRLLGKEQEHEWAVADAEKAFERTKQLQDETFAYNSAEAKETRDWQAEMSNTAYQRGVVDMKAAGLNPAAIGGNGAASVPSGATASSNALSAPQVQSGGYSGNGIVGALANLVMLIVTKGIAAKAGNTAIKAAMSGASVAKSVGAVAGKEIVSAAEMQNALFDEAKRLRKKFNQEHNYPEYW